MSLEDLKKELAEQSQAQEKEIFAEAEAEATRIIKEANTQAAALAEKSGLEAQALATAEERKLSSARLRARQILAQEKEKAISRALGGLFGKLQTLASSRDRAKRKEYEKLFAALVKGALAHVPKDPVILCRKEDFELAGKFGKVSKTPISCAGGAVVASADGTFRVDSTFESMIEEKREMLTRQAHEALFVGTGFYAAPAEANESKASKPARKTKPKKMKAMKKTGKARKGRKKGSR